MCCHEEIYLYIHLLLYLDSNRLCTDLQCCWWGEGSLLLWRWPRRLVSTNNRDTSSFYYFLTPKEGDAVVQNFVVKLVPRNVSKKGHIYKRENLVTPYLTLNRRAVTINTVKNMLYELWYYLIIYKLRRCSKAEQNISGSSKWTSFMTLDERREIPAIVVPQNCRF